MAEQIDRLVTEYVQRGVPGLKADLVVIEKVAGRAEKNLEGLEDASKNLGKSKGVKTLQTEVDGLSISYEGARRRALALAAAANKIPTGVYTDSNGRLRHANGRFYGGGSGGSAPSGGGGSGGSSGGPSSPMGGGRGGSFDGDWFDNAADKAFKWGGAASAAVALVGKAAFDASGNLEKVQAGFSAMLGSEVRAMRMIAEIQKFAKETPFDFSQTAKAAQRLLAMDIAAEDVIPTLRGVGNAVAAAGGGTEEFEGVLMALGQIQTKGKLSQEEINQMAERGVPAMRILKDQLKLTQEQVQSIGSEGIEAAKAIPALVKGFREFAGGNALEKLSNTLPGKVSNMMDSINQLDATLGNLYDSDAKGFIGDLTELIDKTNEFAQANPTLTKGVINAIGITAGTTLAVGGLMKVKGAIGDVVDTAKKATGAKKVLAGATRLDTAAEAAKALVAGKEAGAIGDVADAADAAATAKDLLAGKTAAAGNKAKAALPALTKVKDFLKKPMFGAGNVKWNIPQMRNAPFYDPKALTNTNPFIQQHGWNAAKASAARHGLSGSGGLTNLLGGSGRFALSAPTGMAALGGAALGAGAGMGVHTDLKALGYSDAQANGAAIATGVGAAALAAFNPAAAALIGAATAVRFGIEKAVIEPMETAATEGNGLDAKTMESYGGMSATERADAYFAEAEKKRAESRRIQNQNLFAFNGNDAERARQLDLDAETLTMAAHSELNRERKRQKDLAERPLTPEMEKAGWQRISDAKARERSMWEEHRPGSGGDNYDKAVEFQEQGNKGDENLGIIAGGTAGKPNVKMQRNGQRVINVPVVVNVTATMDETPGDASARRRRRSTIAPAVSYQQ